MEPRVLEFIERDTYINRPTLVLRLLQAGKLAMPYPMMHSGWTSETGTISKRLPPPGNEAAAAAWEEHWAERHLDAP